MGTYIFIHAGMKHIRYPQFHCFRIAQSETPGSQVLKFQQARGSLGSQTSIRRRSQRQKRNCPMKRKRPGILRILGAFLRWFNFRAKRKKGIKIEKSTKSLQVSSLGVKTQVAGFIFFEKYVRISCFHYASLTLPFEKRTFQTQWKSATSLPICRGNRNAMKTDHRSRKHLRLGIFCLFGHAALLLLGTFASPERICRTVRPAAVGENHGVVGREASCSEVSTWTCENISFCETFSQNNISFEA